LKVSILEGKGTGMPGYVAKISDQQARDLVTLVRSFSPTKKSVLENPPPRSGRSLQNLAEEFAALKRDFDDPSNAAPVVIPPKKTELAEPVERFDKTKPAKAFEKTQVVETIRKPKSAKLVQKTQVEPIEKPKSVKPEKSQVAEPVAKADSVKPVEKTRVGAPLDKSKSLPPVGPANAGPSIDPAIRILYAKDCAQCHDANGAGAGSRKLFPETPDFTNAAWQEGRSDVQFKVSILEGKGTGMPGYAAKVSDHQARDLAAMVRTFAPTRKNAKENPAPSFESSFQSLQDQLAALRRDFDEASKITFVATPRETTSVGPIQKTKLVEPLEKTKSAAPVSPADSGPPGDPAVLKLYAKHCGNCHGANGTGTDESRKLFPETPDFTDASWHIRRSDGQFLASILNGKGKGMPAYREKMTEEEASDLAKYVQAFLPIKKSPAKEDEVGSGNSENGNSSLDFYEKLVGWLGKFHRPAVHFPIALLVTAALAEILRMLTGRSSFNSATRFCIWIGALNAVIAATLGWFLAGFQLIDRSWVLTTHRWTGVLTVACALVVLALSELASRYPSAAGVRKWFRLWLFGTAAVVLAVGFFGGAVAFGLDHYAWAMK
jgi:mono/diheme cytochrome c family protein/uncharacterized membrane protein